MSRGGGGFRGGRGGGRGGGPRGGPDIPMGDLNYQDIQSLVNREGRPLYPDYTLPVLRAPDAKDELRVCRHARELTRRLRASPYRLVASERKKDGAGAGGDDQLQAYSDKYKLPTSSSATGLDATKLGLDKSFFPEQLWTAYFDPKTKIKAKKLKREKRKLADGDDAGGDDEENEGEGSEDSDEAGTDQEDQPDYDEEEDDEDYGNQYFDNGEGDDVDDGGGGGGDDEGTY